MRIEKMWKGWILDDQGWRVLFTLQELGRLGIAPSADPWAEHARIALLNADVLLSSAMHGGGEIQSEVKWVRNQKHRPDITAGGVS
jgi:hypothetical protein